MTIRTRGDGSYIAQNECPNCEKPNDSMTQVGGVKDGLIDNGSVTICASCSYPAIVESSDEFGVNLREPSRAELAELLRDPALVLALLLLARSRT